MLGTLEVQVDGGTALRISPNVFTWAVASPGPLNLEVWLIYRIVANLSKGYVPLTPQEATIWGTGPLKSLQEPTIWVLGGLGYTAKPVQHVFV